MSDAISCTQGLKLHPDNVTVSSGCGAVISNLIYCVTQPGEGIAIPAPYYPAFDFDLTVRHMTNCFSFTLQILVYCPSLC